MTEQATLDEGVPAEYLLASGDERLSAEYSNGPVYIIIVRALASIPLRTSRFTVPRGGPLLTLRHISFFPAPGSDARYFSTIGFSVVVSTLPTNRKV